MLQNTEDLAKKRMYEMVCQGTSVNVICYMAQQIKESSRQNMEMNQVQITTMLQFHITFTLASITCVHVQWWSLVNSGL